MSGADDKFAVIESFLADAQEEAVAVSNIDDKLERIKHGIDLTLPSSSLRLAQKELKKADRSGLDTASMWAHYYFVEGRVYLLDAQFGWMKKSVASFKKSIELEPTAHAYQYLGVALWNLFSKRDAIAALERAAEIGDPDEALEARKTISMIEDDKSWHPKMLKWGLLCSAIGLLVWPLLPVGIVLLGGAYAKSRI